MHFNRILREAIGLLVLEKRVSYRRLKRELDLDAGLLDDLRFELTQIRCIAEDENGQVLVWSRGERAVGEHQEPHLTPKELPPIHLAASSSSAPEEHAKLPQGPMPAHTGDTSLHIDKAYAGGERRHLTVMFCDLAGSTEFSTRLDPEDLQDIIRGYQDTVTEIIREFDGFIAKYMGDGVLIYFGYPQAHEDDAQRAVRTGLAIIDAMPALNDRIGRAKDVDLAVRIGVATGLVVVGAVLGEGMAEEKSVVGETPNLAARLQGVAEPNQLVISPQTRRLVEGLFEFEDGGLHQLKGIAEPVQVSRAVSERDIDSQFEATQQQQNLPLVGRQEEVGLLARSWEVSKEGHGQVVLIQGQGGIGKSRLLEALRDQVTAAENYVWVAIRCSPYHTNSTLYPVIEHMKRVLGWQPEDNAEVKLDKLQASLKAQSLPLEEAVPLYAELMSLPLPESAYAPLELSAKQKRDQTLDALAGWLLEEADTRPVLQVWEDLHWADPTTLELLALYIEQSPTVSMLNVLTFRPEFVPPWTMRSHMTPITLNRLERPEVEALIGHQAKGKTVPSAVIEHVVEKADGIPLYVEELTKTILESDYIMEEADRYTLSGSLSDLSIPETLQDSLMARLDRIPRVREVAQLGSVLGREFAYEMLRALAEVEEPILQDGLDQLVDAELLYQRGRGSRAKYIFKHALIQDAAYGSLLKRTRQQYHEHIALLFEERFEETISAQPELLAHHFTEAGNSERAVHYWHSAGERARERSANLEAIAYLTKGTALLQELPDNEERARLELSLQISLGHANIVAKGHGADGAEAAYARASALCDQLGDVPELGPTIFGLWRFYVVARPLNETYEQARKLLRLAEEKAEPELHVIAQYALGYTALCMGRLADARAHFEESLTRYLPTQRSAAVYRAAQDPGVACGAYLAMTEWLLGFPERAQDQIATSVKLAEELADPFSLAYVLCYPGAIVGEACGCDSTADLERGLHIAEERGFSLWHAFGKVHHASKCLREQPSDSALSDLRESVITIPRMGVHTNASYYLTLLATACLEAGRIDEGLKVLDEARLAVDKRGERWWDAEIHRLRGEFLLTQSAANSDVAEASFNQALEISRNQAAKSLELRAAMSIGRLWQSQGKKTDAHRLLEDCYNSFIEGFETVDLKEAKAQLEVGSQILGSLARSTGSN